MIVSIVTGGVRLCDCGTGSALRVSRSAGNRLHALFRFDSDVKNRKEGGSVARIYDRRNRWGVWFDGATVVRLRRLRMTTSSELSTELGCLPANTRTLGTTNLCTVPRWHPQHLLVH